MDEVAAAGFGAAAGTYERGRPGYPAELIELYGTELGVGPGATVVDLAAGTGKLTRLLVATGAEVVAVEPVEAMRRELAAVVTEVEVLDGTAEALPLEDSSADVVTVAQAFHWFDAAPALAEIARVLRPGGGLGLVWNERDESVPWVAELSALFDWETCRPYKTGVDWPGVVATDPSFTPLRLQELAYVQELDVDALVERVLSTSYVAARPPEDNIELAGAVRALVSDFPDRFELPYVTHAYWCHRS